MRLIMPGFKEISHDAFWEAVADPPLLRLGFSNGPGAFICNEPWELRQCSVTGKADNTYLVFAVRQDQNAVSKFFQHRKTLTLHEFKTLVDRIMPGVGICSMNLGAQLLDQTGTLRADLKFPIRRAAY
jgi:hypothetical protein